MRGGMETHGVSVMRPLVRPVSPPLPAPCGNGSEGVWGWGQDTQMLSSLSASSIFILRFLWVTIEAGFLKVGRRFALKNFTLCPCSVQVRPFSFKGCWVQRSHKSAAGSPWPGHVDQRLSAACLLTTPDLHGVEMRHPCKAPGDVGMVRGDMMGLWKL